MRAAFSRYSVTTLGWCALLGAAAVAVPARADVTIYVSPSGNDAWSGALATANAQKSDGPVATPAHARDVARAARAAHKDETISILFGGGNYFLAEPLVLEPQDSGASSQHPTIWAAVAKEPPVFSAGRIVSGWQKTTVNGREAWSAVLPAEAGNFPIRQLWIAGSRAQRARWPKTGTLEVVDQARDKGHADWRVPTSEFHFAEGEVKNWPGAPDGEVIVTSKWVESRMPIESIDQNARLIHSSKKAAFHPETGDRFWLENVKETLSEPGEWQFDPKTRTITLIAPRGIASPNDVEVIVPVFPQVMRLQGDPERGPVVSYLTFRGIGFEHSEWYYDHPASGEKPDPKRTCFNQAAIGVPGAVWGQGVLNCTFENLHIGHVSSYGIELGRRCQQNVISHCLIDDFGAGGVKIGETNVRDDPQEEAFGNRVSDCRIIDGGILFPSACGLWIGQSHDNVVAHNEIGNLWYTGISIGWTWGYGKAASQNNLVEYNEVHHIGVKHDGDLPIMSDMGCIYTLGDEKGTICRNNYFHDAAGLKYGGWGIYFDEGTKDIVAENNLVVRTTHGGFHQHYGQDNIVRNNMFYFGRDAQIQRSRLEDHRAFTFENNLVFWDTGKILSGNWTKLNADFDHNTYCPAGSSDMTFGKLSWDDWRKQGADVHSMIADPETIKALRDMKLTEAVASKLAGIKPFDLSTVGPRSVR